MSKPEVHRTVELKEMVLRGGQVSNAEALWLLRKASRRALYDAAHEITLTKASSEFDFCAIVSARQGMCPENCKWCAQSSHWNTGCESHGWIGSEACVVAAKSAQTDGVSRIGIVTSGRGQSDREIADVADALRAMRHETDIGLCASLGLVTEDQLKLLKRLV